MVFGVYQPLPASAAGTAADDDTCATDAEAHSDVPRPASRSDTPCNTTGEACAEPPAPVSIAPACAAGSACQKRYRLVGCARAVSDGVHFAYLSDVRAARVQG